MNSYKNYFNILKLMLKKMGNQYNVIIFKSLFRESHIDFLNLKLIGSCSLLLF